MVVVVVEGGLRACVNCFATITTTCTPRPTIDPNPTTHSQGPPPRAFSV